MSDWIEKLSRLDACSVSDAMDSLGLAAAVTGLRRLSSDRTIAGKVITVRLGETRPEGAPLRHLCTTAIDSGGAGTVIVVEQRTGKDAAGWGGVLSTAASLKGIEGVIVEGPTRDIDEARGLKFPVFARSTTARTARNRVYEQQTGGPVAIGDQTVNSGDYVIADDSGVVFIPADRVGDVVGAAERISAREKLMTDALRAGMPVSEVMGADYEHMLDTLNKDRG